MSKIERNTRAKNHIVADVGTDGLRGLFRLVMGKPNTLIELFPNPIQIAVNDIEDLNRQIAEKLKYSTIHAVEFAAIISYENNKFEEYGSLDKFITNNWSIPDVTSSLVLKWHFLIQFPNTSKPENHSVIVRLASTPKPFEILQAVMSKDPDELEDFEVNSAPMSCRIDFADHLLSQELLAIISRWNKSRRCPKQILPILKKVKKFDDEIGAIIKYGIPLFTLSVCFSYFDKLWKAYDYSSTLTIGIFREVIIGIIFSLLVGFISFKLSEFPKVILIKISTKSSLIRHSPCAVLRCESGLSA